MKGIIIQALKEGKLFMSDHRQKYCIKYVVACLLVSLFAATSFSFLTGCADVPENAPASKTLKGESTYWSVKANIPYTPMTDDAFVTITFTCRFIDHIYDEHDIVSFSVGTSKGVSSYSYMKSEGYIKSDYLNDQIERVIHISDDTFEVLFDFDVLFDQNIFDPDKNEAYRQIQIQIGSEGETIHLSF